MFSNLIGKNKELGRFLFCERYTLPPVKNAMYIAEGQELKRGAVVDVNGVLVGTNSLMPYAVLEFDCDTRSGGKEASVFIKGEFNFDKLYFADGLDKSDLDNIVYNGNGLGIVIKPYEYAEGFSPSMVPAGTSDDNPLVNESVLDEKLEELEISTMRSVPISKGMRFVFSKKDYNPIEANIGSGTWKRVGTYANIWDFNRTQSSWSGMFSSAFGDSENIVSIIAADVSHVTTFQNIFNSCSSLKDVCDLNSSSCTTFYQAFNRCTSLEHIGVIDTTVATSMSDTFFSCQSLGEIPDITGTSVSNIHNFCYSCSKITRIPTISSTAITDCGAAFRGCTNVETGALDMYNQLSSQSTPPSVTANCFTFCGSSTTTGAAELAQIPESWGGTATASLNIGAPQNLTEPLSPSVIEGDDSLTK